MDRSSSRMEKLAAGGRGLQPSGSENGGQNAFNSPKSSVRALAVTQRFISNLSSSTKFCVVLSLASTYLSVVSAQANFSYPGNTYNCSSKWICLGTATVFNTTGYQTLNGSSPVIPWNGSLSLIPAVTPETRGEALNKAGVVYCRKPVKLLDPSTNTAVSFSTYFVVEIVKGIDDDNVTSDHGDGMTFVISADNSTVGSDGSAFGIFNRTSTPTNYTTNSTSIVVEFDTVWNQEYPINDIDDNHVSFDFTSIHTSSTASAFSVGVDLSSSFQAWVEYNNETQLLEVRVSANNDSKPGEPLLSHQVDLVEVVEEYMWVGFTAGSGGEYSNYYIQNWTFTVGPLPTSGGRNWVPMIVGLSLGVPVLLACIVVFLLACIVVQRIYRNTGGYRDAELVLFRFTKELIQLEGVPTEFNYRELCVACNSFGQESLLGEGGFGSVYSGVLPVSGRPFSGRSVAVKKIKADSKQGKKEFMAEVSIITQLKHRNLLQLLGWCKAPKKQYLLVYELMPHGSLDKKLFGLAEEQTASLSWEKRFNIVTGTAAALDYLHQGCTTQVIHRDIKSSNIMLDEEWNAKLGDFGLARLVDPKREANIIDVSDIAGTHGYLAPEVAMSINFSEKSDVFGFGAVVLEVACGRKAWSVHLPQDQRGLVKWVWNSFSKGDLMTTVDQRLEEYDVKKMEMMLSIGLLCSHPHPDCRPSMRSVVQYLAGDAPVPSVPLLMPTFNSVPHQGIVSDFSNDRSTTGSQSTPRSTLGSQSTHTSFVSNTSSHSSQGSATRFFSSSTKF